VPHGSSADVSSGNGTALGARGNEIGLASGSVNSQGGPGAKRRSSTFAKVWLYSNSRLPPHLPPLKV
jgi:hypothetical protein